jgi:RimJ/RimL family protein N-acetyltransferase
MLTTDRLTLRPWREEDRAPFAAMNADPEVMRYFPSVQTRAESDASVDRLMARQEAHGFCFWAAEGRVSGTFVGMIGIQHAPEAVPAAPAIEIGWRLDRAVWGQGLAPEGARAALAFVFFHVGAREVVAFTAVANTPSRRVMEKIGMTRDMEGDFDHPLVPEGSAVRAHVLYRIKATDPIG